MINISRKLFYVQVVGFADARRNQIQKTLHPAKILVSNIQTVI